MTRKMIEVDVKEQEANYFAMHLLIPTDLLKPLLKEMDIDMLGDEKKIRPLAKQFQVPYHIMLARLTEYYFEELK